MHLDSVVCDVGGVSQAEKPQMWWSLGTLPVLGGKSLVWLVRRAAVAVLALGVRIMIVADGGRVGCSS